MPSLPTQFQHHLALAQQGDKEAQYWTADCYFEGKEGVAKNETEAFKWFQRAADQGSGKAMFRLGRCYRWGGGVGKDVSQACRLWKESIPVMEADANKNDHDSESMWCLGTAFWNVDRNGQKLLYWTQQAAELGHAEAQYHLGCAHGSGKHFGLPPNKQLAFHWYQRAADSGHDFSQCLVADAYRRGLAGVVERDWIQSLYWYQKAENSGIVGDARYCLDDLRQVIDAKRIHLETCVKESLLTSKASFPTSLWAHGLAKLMDRRHQPAGFTPTFLAVKAVLGGENSR